MKWIFRYLRGTTNVGLIYGEGDIVLDVRFFKFELVKMEENY